ncbi:right-handed parallel beta-helix repeat-containing protein [Solibacillus sp. A46]|uniref:Right-handed parallel beta-helix repeat-containing protein n=1 Tax=Solibacillus faecavium TaxID=2762221 RepID=A0ABR8XVZ8_9BACL|nr:right-handed parallel beta-helix repeat-containing protein [Solibacillus faecavium]MBD8036117.1 right-handed parallel beta-helix repeat-containing protein [Solibacillus faecavium]
MVIVKVSTSFFSTVKTISRAVQKATNDDIIVVNAGKYKETLAFLDSRTITAKNAGTVVVEGAILIAKSAVVTFENMTIQPTSQIFVEGQLILKNCVIQGGLTNVLIAMKGGYAHCEKTHFRDAPDIGITLISNSKAHFEYCHFEQNKKVHILLENSTAHLENCELSKGNQAIWAKTNSKTYLNNVKVHHHSGTQIVIQDHSLLDIKESEIKQGEGNGIYASENSIIHLAQTTVHHHTLPQLWIQKSSLNISECQIQHGSESGIMLREYAEATISDTLLSFHKIANVQLTFESLLNMTNSEVLNSQGVGIQLKEKSIANFTDTLFAHNVLPQLFITENSICTLKSVTIEDGKQIGVFAEKGSSCSIVSSTITGHKNAALTVIEAEMFLLNTTIHHNNGNGLFAVNNAKATLDNCQFNHNDLAHIAGKNDSTIHISHSELTGGKSIFVIDHCQLDIIDSVIKDGTGAQIEMIDHINATIQNSKIIDGQTNGIIAMKDTSVNIIESQISSHKMPQVIVNDSSIIFKNSELLEGDRNGFIIKNHAEALIQDSFISNHGYPQIWIDSESTVELKATQLTEGRESDIYVQNNSVLHASNCIIQNAKFNFNIQAVNFSKIYLAETMVDNSFGSKFYSENNSQITYNMDEIS